MVSIDGFYSVFMSGLEGQGFALVALINGKIVGADPFGITFDGTYSWDGQANRHRANVKVNAPANGHLIQGVDTGPSGICYDVAVDLPKDFFKVEFIEIKTPLGPVNAKFQLIRGI